MKTATCHKHLEQIGLVSRAADWKLQLLANRDELVGVVFTLKIECLECGVVELGTEEYATMLKGTRYSWRDLAWIALRKALGR